VKLIIDPGALSRAPHADQVQSHLAASPKNQVIFSDFALQEAFKDANIKGLRRTFAPVRDFPAQISALRLTPEICRLEPREDMQGRLVDEVQSNRLRTYLHEIYSEGADVHARIELGSSQAGQRFQDLMQAIPQVKADITRQIGSFSSEDISLLKNEGRISRLMIDAIVKAVIHDTALHLHDIGVPKLPQPYDVVHSFVLRFVLANHVSGLFWGITGGHSGAMNKTLRNDVTDATYAAYATFFDGLVTRDDKLGAVYRNTKLLLREGFGVG
jgi:hypothetical protein